MTYNDRYELTTKIIEKLKSGEKLTAAESEYVEQVLKDPLDEFCYREGTFRLMEFFGIKKKDASELEDEAYKVVRNEVDYCETLYDYFDEALADMLEEHGYSSGYVKEDDDEEEDEEEYEDEEA